MTDRVTRYVGFLDDDQEPAFLVHTLYFKDTVTQEAKVFNTATAEAPAADAEAFLTEVTDEVTTSDLPSILPV